MSMMPPPFTAGPADEGIPAADPGAGAPPPAPGFGIEGEEPDTDPAQDQQEDGGPEVTDRETPFRGPDPQDSARAPE